MSRKISPKQAALRALHTRFCSRFPPYLPRTRQTSSIYGNRDTDSETNEIGGIIDSMLEKLRIEKSGREGKIRIELSLSQDPNHPRGIHITLKHGKDNAFRYLNWGGNETFLRRVIAKSLRTLKQFEKYSHIEFSYEEIEKPTPPSPFVTYHAPH